MTEVLISPYVIAALFFLAALAYSSVGLGGGSAYTALMAILGFNALAIPMVSLTLNLFVTSIGSYLYIRKGHASLSLITPFLVTSIPMAYLGGALQIPQEAFYWVLLLSLFFVAARIFFWKDTAFQIGLGRTGNLVISALAGSVLGLVAGVVGIGGGIYLVPLIIILGLGSEKQAAACGVLFVWLNSLAGLISRMQYNAIDLTDYIPLIVAVILGGALGSFMGSSRLSPGTMEKILGAIVMLAIFFLVRRILAF